MGSIRRSAREGLMQPRWGWDFCRFSQGGSFLATLGWRMESRWDSLPPKPPKPSGAKAGRPGREHRTLGPEDPLKSAARGLANFRRRIQTCLSHDFPINDIAIPLFARILSDKGKIIDGKIMGSFKLRGRSPNLFHRRGAKGAEPGRSEISVPLWFKCSFQELTSDNHRDTEA